MTPRTAIDLPRHPIGVVTERTGVSAHALRAWERRYAVVEPRRGERGQRLYSDADVERLALMHRATRAGRPVASVAPMRIAQLRALVADDAARSTTRLDAPATHRTRALGAVVALDVERLEAQLRRALLSLGTASFLEDVVTPLMVEIGGGWHAGRITIAQEHAATATVSRLLGGLIRDLDPPGPARCVAIATPRGERHAVGALIAAADASLAGWHVLWLGTDLPASQIASAAAQGRADAVALSLPTRSAGHASEVRLLRRKLEPHVPLFVGGNAAGRLAAARGVTAVRDLAHWRALLRIHGPKA